MPAILSYMKDGRPARETSPTAVRAEIGRISCPYWLSLTSPGEEDLKWLGENWGFHPLTLEDCRTYNPRPKLEEYSGYLFLVLHEVSLDKDTLATKDLQFYFSQDYVVSVQKEESAVLREVLERGGDLSRGTDFLLYRFMNQIAEGYFEFIGGMDERIEEVEEQVVSSPGRQVLHRIFHLRQDLVSMLRLAAPFREMLNLVNSREYPFVQPDHRLYFRDVYNSLVFIHEMIETQRDLTSGALEAYMSVVSNNLNDVLKRLTLIATIFMPISFIAAFFGMNFRSLPFDDAVVMAATLGVIVALPLGMLVWFRKTGWV